MCTLNQTSKHKCKIITYYTAKFIRTIRWLSKFMVSQITDWSDLIIHRLVNSQNIWLKIWSKQSLATWLDVSCFVRKLSCKQCQISQPTEHAALHLFIPKLTIRPTYKLMINKYASHIAPISLEIQSSQVTWRFRDKPQSVNSY